MEKIAFDLETTGANIAEDRIVQIAVLILDENLNIKQEIRKLINPTIPISEGAFNIHHINNEDVKDAPTFKSIAKSLANLFNGREIIGYSVLQFDLPILLAEFDRAGVECELSKQIIDVLNIEKNLFPRNLSFIYEKYTGEKLKDAHDALADIKATVEILKHQTPLMSKKDIYELSESKGILDYTSKLGYTDKGEVVFNFGKHKGIPFKQIKKKDPKYFDWVLGEKSDFSNQVKKIVKDNI